MIGHFDQNVIVHIDRNGIFMDVPFMKLIPGDRTLTSKDRHGKPTYYYHRVVVLTNPKLGIDGKNYYIKAKPYYDSGWKPNYEQMLYAADFGAPYIHDS